MSRHPNKAHYHELHRAMLRLQASIHPFTPTFRELKVAWNMRSVSNVHYYLQRMLAMGLVQCRRKPNAEREILEYYAITEQTHE